MFVHVQVLMDLVDASGDRRRLEVYSNEFLVGEAEEAEAEELRERLVQEAEEAQEEPVAQRPNNKK